MKKSTYIVAGVLFTAILIVALVFTIQAGNISASKKPVETDIAAITAEKSAIDTANETDNAAIAAANAEIDAKTVELEAAKAALQSATDEVAGIETELGLKTQSALDTEALAAEEKAAAQKLADDAAAAKESAAALTAKVDELTKSIADKQAELDALVLKNNQ